MRAIDDNQVAELASTIELVNDRMTVIADQTDKVYEMIKRELTV